MKNQIGIDISTPSIIPLAAFRSSSLVFMVPPNRFWVRSLRSYGCAILANFAAITSDDIMLSRATAASIGSAPDSTI
jgi:hypothetical protein